jgi:hypothetical protein
MTENDLCREQLKLFQLRRAESACRQAGFLKLGRRALFRQPTRLAAMVLPQIGVQLENDAIID